MRRGRRVVRQYVGAGKAGEAAAAIDRHRRMLQAAEREASAALLQHLAEQDASVVAFCDAVETVTRAFLLMAGFHRHDRGAWRRIRG